MAIKYLKKAIKTPSTDDYKTRVAVQDILDDIEKRTGSKLDMTNVDDAKTVQNLLIKQGKQDEIEFNDDLKEFGQMRNAVCTHEGRVINGNRRMAGLQTLSEDNPNRKDFGFTDTVKMFFETL